MYEDKYESYDFPDPMDIKDLIKLFIEEHGLKDGQPHIASKENWIKIIGPKLAPHVRIADIKNTTLILRSDHPTWSSLANMQKKAILYRINKNYPELGIQSIQIVLD